MTAASTCYTPSIGVTSQNKIEEENIAHLVPVEPEPPALENTASELPSKPIEKKNEPRLEATQEVET